MLTTTARNTMLDALTLSHIAAHTAFPGNSGTNEVSGGSYARGAATMNASSGGIRALNAAVNINIPAGVTVRWVSLFNALSSGACQAVSPNGGNPQEFEVLAATDVFYAPAHGYADTTQIVFYNGSPPAPLVEGTIYFVRDSTTDSFKVAATSGGTAIDITTAGDASILVSAIVQEAFAGAGTLQVTTFPVSANN